MTFAQRSRHLSGPSWKVNVVWLTWPNITLAVAALLGAVALGGWLRGRHDMKRAALIFGGDLTAPTPVPEPQTQGWFQI